MKTCRCAKCGKEVQVKGCCCGAGFKNKIEGNKVVSYCGECINKLNNQTTDGSVSGSVRLSG